MLHVHIDIPPKSALTPPMPTPAPMPVMNASRTQGLLCSSLNSSALMLLNAFEILASGVLPPAVFAVPPGIMLAFLDGSYGTCLPPCHCASEGLVLGVDIESLAAEILGRLSCVVGHLDCEEKEDWFGNVNGDDHQLRDLKCA